MAPLPKRKHSTARQGRRRKLMKAIRPNSSLCSSCGKTVLSHRVCGNCGFYRGKQYFTPKVKKKKE